MSNLPNKKKKNRKETVIQNTRVFSKSEFGGGVGWLVLQLVASLRRTIDTTKSPPEEEVSKCMNHEKWRCAKRKQHWNSPEIKTHQYEIYQVTVEF